MNSGIQNSLNWIVDQYEEMIDTLSAWANINSCTDNIEGLEVMAQAITTHCNRLEIQVEKINLPNRFVVTPKGTLFEEPLGKALRFCKHSEAPLQILLAGHMDTVYPAVGSFQKCEIINQKKMRGPGVTDMKGGLLVMLYALEALERSFLAGKIGWEVIINSDEEVGSPGSTHLFTEAARRNHFGLVFEPAFPDGSFVSSRKGSANFTIVAKGRGAHAGRDFQHGRNAITALARILLKIEKLTQFDQGIIVNIGHITGGGPVNIVPDLATAKFNVRTNEKNDMEKVTNEVHNFIREGNQTGDGIFFVIHEHTKTPPKPFNEPIQTLFAALKIAADSLNIPLSWKPSGGTCDGSRLYAEGLPNIDTMGVVGGDIHTHNEYIELDSLKERTLLTASFLMQLASREIILNPLERMHEQKYV